MNNATSEQLSDLVARLTRDLKAYKEADTQLDFTEAEMKAFLEEKGYVDGNAILIGNEAFWLDDDEINRITLNTEELP